MSNLERRPEMKKQPLSPDQFRANNRAVFSELQRRVNLEPGNPEKLDLSPMAMRALELYTTEISLIPRGPGNKAGMVAYFSDYTARFNANPDMKETLSYQVDKGGNVLLGLKAQGGEDYSEQPKKQYQGHYDQVCEKEEGYPDPADHGVALQLVTKKHKKTGEDQLWMQAYGTSAGIDCAWSVAWAMAKLEDVARSGKPHSGVELLVTADEEIGLLGAKAFSFTPAQLGKIPGNEIYLLNLDNENLNGLVGCAGISVVDVSLPVTREPYSQGLSRLAFSVHGSIAGHSGDERDRIGNGRWNKISLATDMVQEVRSTEGLENIQLVSIKGGGANNAIPQRVHEVVLAVPSGQEDRVLQILQSRAQERNSQALQDYTRFKDSYEERAEFDRPDEVTVQRVQESEESAKLQPMTPESTAQALELLSTLEPNGVLGIEWSPEDSDAVATSSNLASVTTDEDGVKVVISSRSSDPEKMYSRPDAIRQVVTSLGATYKERPEEFTLPWEPDFTDPMVAMQKKVYDQVFGPGHKYKVTTIHAGVEVKVLRDKYREIFGQDFVLHGVSHGPRYTEPHSTNEAGLILSFNDFDRFENALDAEISEYEHAKQTSAKARRSQAA